MSDKQLAIDIILGILTGGLWFAFRVCGAMQENMMSMCMPSPLVQELILKEQQKELAQQEGDSL